MTDATGTLTFTYDANGNTTGDGTWNQENRLAAVDWETETANLHLAYKYDGLGRRREVAKSGTLKVGGSISPQVIRFVYNGNNLVAELDGQDDNAILRKYVWGLDLSGTLSGAAGVGGLLAVSDGTSTHYPTYDANGNITAYLDASDNAVYTAEYSPFGKILSESGTAPAQFGFSTIYRDAETGFLAYRFRDYDPNLGRWPARDPVGEMGGINLYGMVGNDPVNLYDIFGLEVTQHATIGLEEFIGMVDKWEKGNKDLSCCEEKLKGLMKSITSNNEFSSSTGSSAEQEGAVVEWRYIYTEKAGWIDTGHFATAAHYSHFGGEKITKVGGYAIELLQFAQADSLIFPKDSTTSAFTREDLGSNRLGAEFATYLKNTKDDCSSLANSLRNFLNKYTPYNNPSDAPDFNSLPVDQEDLTKR